MADSQREENQTTIITPLREDRPVVSKAYPPPKFAQIDIHVNWWSENHDWQVSAHALKRMDEGEYQPHGDPAIHTFEAQADEDANGRAKQFLLEASAVTIFKNGNYVSTLRR